MISVHKDVIEANSREVKRLLKINGKLGTRTSKDKLVKHKFRLEVGRSFVRTREVKLFDSIIQ